MLTALLGLSAVSCFVFPRGFDRPRQWLAPVLAPLSHSGAYVASTVRRNLASDDALRRAAADQVDAALRRQVIAYERAILEYRSVLGEVAAARDALGESFPCMLLPATVIGGAAGPYDDSRLLRTEGRAGRGQYVTTLELLTGRPTAVPEQVAALSGAAVVGRVVASGAWTAQLQLLTDRGYRMRAYVWRQVYEGRDRRILIAEPDPVSGATVLRERSLKATDPVVPVNLTGVGDGLLSAEVPVGHAIEPGDVVVTMGDDGRLPMQVTVGYVDRVETPPDSPKHVRLHVAPATDLDALRRVSIVVPLARRAP